MPQALKAIYHSGTFILQTAYDLPEGTEVELFVKSPQIIPPKITDIAARQNFWFFGLSYATDRIIRDETLIEKDIWRFLSIVFDPERTNQLNLLPDKDLLDLCPPIEP